MTNNWDSIKKYRVIDEKHTITTGIWYHNDLQEYHAYYVTENDRKFLVAAVTERFIMEDEDPNSTWEYMLRELKKFEERNLKKGKLK